MASRDSRNTGTIVLLILLMILMIAATVFVIKLCLEIPDQTVSPRPTDSLQLPLFSGDAPTETPTETTLPEPERVVSTATIGSMGDLLMHKPIFDDLTEYNAAVQKSDGSYDFESVFRYLKDTTINLDYAVANLETTLAGQDNGYAYSGYPNFNCPDEVVDGVRDAGFDLLLTANNHSYDTSLVGYKRTLEVIRDKGLATLGTYASADETKWSIQTVNDIRIGMLCYTYATSATEDGRPSLNFMPAISEAGLCNYFVGDNLQPFYEEVARYLEEMEAAGVEATMLYIHWGTEYMTAPTEQQEAIAQALCDLGIDVIVGGHPHMVQPVQLLESTVDPEHKTVCLYSMGNAVSNQRLGNLQSVKTAHTEDGVLFTVTFEKYSDGTVYLAGADIIPTWVNMHLNGNGKTEYNILPLEESRQEEWKTMFEIEDSTLNAAKNSYERTMAIVEEGLRQCQTYLADQKEAREEYYLDLINSTIE